MKKQTDISTVSKELEEILAILTAIAQHKFYLTSNDCVVDENLSKENLVNIIAQHFATAVDLLGLKLNTEKLKELEE